jgi:pimeloyl-ACP methyl ester carboxylesterase
MPATEIRLETRNGRFAGLAWPQPGAPRMICLHGWLDNAASFLPLAPLLESLDLVALDFAGHGHSDHRPPGARYYMMDNLWDLDAVLDALEWDQCHLLGHSLGGAVASIYAATEPGRVEKLVALDGLGPLTEQPGNTVRRLRRSLEWVRKASGGLRDYADPDDAARARERASGLPFEAARLLCTRALAEHGGSYRWRTDPALNWHSPALLWEEQVLEILSAIRAPTLALTSHPLAEWIPRDRVQHRLQAVPNCRHHRIEGHHHFHMDQPQRTAQFILDFLASPEQSDDRHPPDHSEP